MSSGAVLPAGELLRFLVAWHTVVQMGQAAFQQLHPVAARVPRGIEARRDAGFARASQDGGRRFAVEPRHEEGPGDVQNAGRLDGPEVQL